MFKVGFTLSPTSGLKNADRVSSYFKNENKLKFDRITFPVQLGDIHKVGRTVKINRR